MAQAQGGRNRNRPRNRNRRRDQVDRAFPLACDFVNPFSPILYKVPDEFSGKSVSYRTRFQYAITGDATHKQGSMLMLPRIRTGLFPAPNHATITTNTDWGPGVDVPDYTTLSTNLDRYRIVSWGFRATSVGKGNLFSGHLTILTFADSKGASEHLNVNDPAMRRDLYAINPNLDVTWVSEPLHNRAREFFPINDTGSDGSYNWTYPAVWITGTDADTTVMLDIVYTLEALAAPGTLTEKLSTKAAPEDNGFMHVVRDVYEHAASTYNTFAQDVRDSDFMQRVVFPQARKHLVNGSMRFLESKISTFPSFASAA